ncbi:kinase-like domain-containing protein [Rhizophagus irregularis DAOM 181602=DAOM 197198]|nr:kinase-like domain-containing protein [Rhizophagus irregularis DAOM 181602=DAOM 197198]CAB4488117.1 unnamed protein product [Rhizophagus irregularis]
MMIIQVIKIKRFSRFFRSFDDALREHKSKNSNRRLAWESFKHHSSTSLEAKYWLGYYCYHDKEIPKLQQINRRLRIKTYGICLWQGVGVAAFFKYLRASKEFSLLEWW